MLTGIYKIAGKVIEINSLYDEVHELCEQYKSNGACDFSIMALPEDIEREREKSARTDEAEGNPVRCFSDSYLETLAVYRHMADKMLEYDTLLMHGSTIAVDGAGYLFTAKSGTGKSTHTRLWREYFGERAVMINDDKPLIRIEKNGEVIVYGTPWDGKHRLSTNTSVLLKAIVILERDSKNHIERISPKAAYPMLMQQIYRSDNRDSLVYTLKLIDSLMKNVEFYRLGCNMSTEAAVISYNAISK